MAGVSPKSSNGCHNDAEKRQAYFYIWKTKEGGELASISFVDTLILQTQNTLSDLEEILCERENKKVAFF